MRGTTLIELLIVLAVLGLLAAVGLPGFAGLRDALLVNQAAESLRGVHARARLVAVVEQRVTLLTLTPDSFVVRAVESPRDTMARWRGDGPARTGVATSGMPRTVLFAPSGVSFGLANATYGLSRGAAEKRVVVSRYGRVRIE